MRPTLVLLLLLTGCTAGPSWYWKPAAEIGGQATRDIALWSWPDTEASIVLECNDEDLRIVFVGVEPEPPQSVVLRAGSAAFPGTYAVDPLDGGYGSSVILVPLDTALVQAMARGAPSLRVQWPDNRGSIPLGPIPSRFVRYCLAREAGG